MGEYLASMGPAVANHLWQSTAFAVVAAGLALLLKRKQARVRYWLWLAASVKFLVPFALLIGLGGMLPRPQHAVVTMPVYSAVDEVGLPFSDTETMPAAGGGPTHAAIRPRHEWGTLPGWPVVLAAVWFCGGAVVLAMWWVRWRQVASVLCRAKLAGGGQVRGAREVELLRRVERMVGARVRLVLSRELMEPGIFGVFRPVLIWPEGLSDRLDDEHIEAILAHELMHVRRRDNLAAAIHMLVEAAFWFHPLVWWIQRRMVEERERACDEAVVELGSRPGVYAESLLKAVRFCVESPLVCVAGVTGADLKKRVRSIMTLRLRKLGLAGKVALAVLALAAIVGPVAFGVVRMIPMYGQVFKATGPLPSYDVVVIKPSQEGVRGADTEGEQTHYLITAKLLIQFAYGVFNPGKMAALNVVGGPDWINTDVFDIVGKTSPADFEQRQKMTRTHGHEQRQLMEQSLLADRFKLRIHTEMQDQPVYALTVMRGGPKMTPAKDVTGGAHVNPSPGTMTPEELKRGLIVRAKGRGFEMTVKGMTLDAFVDALMTQKETSDRPVVDQTGLTGAYDFTLVWGPEETAPSESGDAEELPLFAAIQQQLGLKLVNSKAPAEVVVIDHIEKPVFDSAATKAVKGYLDAAANEVQQMLEHQGVYPPDSARARFVPVGQEMTNPTRDDTAVANGAPGDGQKQVLHGVYKVWLDQDVRWIISDQEVEAFKQLTNDEERDRFIEQFWQRRNPNPDDHDNSYRDQIYARIAYANENFASGQPGWMTDRGRVYIVYGKPDEIVVQPADATQIWRYRHLAGVGDNVVLKFGDGERKDDYRLMTPLPQAGAGTQTPNPLKRRLTDLERIREAGHSDPKQRLNGAAMVGALEAGGAPVGILPEMRFEVASIKPSPANAPVTSGPHGTAEDFSARMATVESMIAFAYGIPWSLGRSNDPAHFFLPHPPNLVGGQGWVANDAYDLTAKADAATVEAWSKLPTKDQQEELRRMMRALLEERFHLAVHHELREMPVWALVVAKDGPKLGATTGPPPDLNDGSDPAKPFDSSKPYQTRWKLDRGVIQGRDVTIAEFDNMLWGQREIDSRKILDQTGLTGRYDLTLKWASVDDPRESDGPSLFSAIQEQLGLKLESTKGRVPVLVIDHVEKPSPN